MIPAVPAIKQATVMVSTEFLTDMLVSISDGSLPSDTMVFGVYYDPKRDAFCFQIGSFMLNDREECTPLPEIRCIKRSDFTNFISHIKQSGRDESSL